MIVRLDGGTLTYLAKNKVGQESQSNCWSK